MKRVNPKIIFLELVMRVEVVTVFSAYAPQSTRNAEEKDEFYIKV